MHVVYDTRTVSPLERYECYREGAAAELAPVAVDGGPLPDLLAVMSMFEVGDFTLEVVTWKATTPVVARRTEHLIRAGDPECYRIVMTVNAGFRMEQAGHRVLIRERDIGLVDLSVPWEAIHPERTFMRVIMLTFPRALVPLAGRSVRSLLGTTVPRGSLGRSLIAQALVELATTEAAESTELARPDVLQECSVGLIRHWLGQPAGISPQTRRLLDLARIRAIIRRHLHHPTLDPGEIANAAHISPRYLHRIFQDAELPLMQLVKRMRLEECHRSVQDPALLNTPIKDISSRYGYRRPDQFARDFKQLYGTSARDLRRLANNQLAADGI
jgi:AraC-like DNA-binding protein